MLANKTGMQGVFGKVTIPQGLAVHWSTCPEWRFCITHGFGVFFVLYSFCLSNSFSSPGVWARGWMGAYLPAGVNPPRLWSVRLTVPKKLILQSLCIELLCSMWVERTLLRVGCYLCRSTENQQMKYGQEKAAMAHLHSLFLEVPL